MYTYRYGGKDGTAYKLAVSDDMVVVRTKTTRAIVDSGGLAEVVESDEGKRMAFQLSPVVEFRDASVTVYQCRGKGERIPLRDRARQVLKEEKNVRFAGRVLKDVNTGVPVVYTENFFIKFHDHVTVEDCEKILKHFHLKIKNQPKYAKNAYFVCAEEGTGIEIFEITDQLLEDGHVECCHPELIRENRSRAIHPQQWHLQRTVINGVQIYAHVNVETAWFTIKGEGIVIAVIDDGVDIDHEEFNIPGKIVHPRDVTLNTDDPRPKDIYDNHGTACAGVACAAGKFQASGVAPEAKLMPIRLRSGLGSQAEANAFVWAADHGADVISCSWGPTDGDWSNPNDSRHRQKVALPDSTRLAIDYAIREGRNGKGCVIVWAAGNGNESADNDGYVSYDKIITVAACNDRSTRCVYSDYGKAVWCAFPSSDFAYAPANHPAPFTPGIWTIDRKGSAGYNPGVLNSTGLRPPGDDHGHYTQNFGGTSSSCPGVAGIAGLILAVYPDLHWDQVKDIIRRSTVRIDPFGGDYDENGHSHFYGYGRADAANAIHLTIDLKAHNAEMEKK